MVGKEDLVERLLTEIEEMKKGFQQMTEKVDKTVEEVQSLKEKLPRDVIDVKTSAANSDLTAGTDVAFNEHLNSVLRALIRERFFKLEKFVTDQTAEMIVNQAMFTKRIQPMAGQTEDALRKQCKQIVKTTFNSLRGHMQSQARKNFLSKICCFDWLLF